MRLQHVSAALGALVLWCATCSAPALGAVTCSFTVASGVNFGNYDVFNGATTTANGTLTFNCTGVGPGGDSVTIALNRGLHSPVLPNRNMANGAQLLSYNLYTNAALTIIWGNGNHGTVEYGPITAFDSTPVTVTIYGAIPAGQDLTAGSYTAVSYTHLTLPTICSV